MPHFTPSTYVISLTPFTADGKLDESGLRGHYRRLAAAGIGVYVTGSGSGEGYTLSDGEIRRILEIAKEELQGKVPVRAMGREPRTSGEMIAFGKVVKEIGLDAMQIYSCDVGHGNQPNAREMETYLRDVLDAVDIPVVPSIHQSVGYLYPVELMAKLIGEYKHIVGLNVSTGNIQYTAQITEAVGAKVEIHTGGPGHALSTLALGGTGYLSSEGNLAPKLCVSLIEHYKAERYQQAEEAYKQILSLWPVTYKYGSIRGTKAALSILGLPGGYPRKPRLPVPDEAIPEIARKIEELKLRELEGLPAA
ncbi:MAG TPA: dihydrodipicolinate synthase family protein [Chloroflexota bacterium]|jgi:4-hydroxy-tetrahydrodipicolinate synthase|nr:dihydrodipicolinate synthase family protein [Chloroflexota bacterium]